VTLPRPGVVASVAAGAVVASVLVTALVSSAPSVAATSSAAVVVTSQPLASADLVCPVPATVKGASQATITAGAAATRAGTLSLYRLAGPLTAKPLAEVSAGASTFRYAVPVGKATTLELRATGGYAPGLAAEVTIAVSSGPARSLQSVPCSAAGSDAWFVGGGAAVGRRSVLLLSNIDAAPATVDVSVYSSAGLAQPTPVQGVTVQPRSQMTFTLDQLVPGVVATAVHVSTRSGRVATALVDNQVNGLQPQGADWVPATSGPGLKAVITGIPGDADAKTTLGLVVPGADDAVVNVHLVTSQGTLSPVPLQELSAVAGKLTTVAIPAGLAPGPFAVVVESDRPVVGGVRTLRSPAHSGGFPDFSYSAASDPLASLLVLTGVAHTSKVSTLLQLTAPGDSDVVVSVTTTTGASPATAKVPPVAAGAPVTVRITITAGTTVQLALGPVGAALSTVQVETAKGAAPVFVGWVLTRADPQGPLVTGGPVPQTPLTVVLPAVAADPAAGYPGH
jgi:hypothetical protein